MYVWSEEMERFFSLRLRSQTVVKRWSPRREWEDRPSWWGRGRFIERKWSTRTFGPSEAQQAVAWMRNTYAYTPVHAEGYQDAAAVCLTSLTAGANLACFAIPPTFAVQRYTLATQGFTLIEDEPDELCGVWLFREPRSKPKSDRLSQTLARHLGGKVTTCIPVAGTIGHRPSDPVGVSHRYQLVEVEGRTYNPDDLLAQLATRRLPSSSLAPSS